MHFDGWHLLHFIYEGKVISFYDFYVIEFYSILKHIIIVALNLLDFNISHMYIIIYITSYSKSFFYNICLYDIF